MGFFAVVSPAEALSRLRAVLPARPAGREEVALADALGRVAAEDLRAEADVPGFARSTVDGYAVRAQDTFGASPDQPAYFELAGEVVMGRPADGEVTAGTAVAVPTGGMLPPGADAVVMIEHTAELGDGRTVEVLRPAAPGENVVAAGEDFRRGQVVIPAGRRLSPADLGALAAVGAATVPVFPVPRVAVLATGNELVPPEGSPGPGQVRDVNSVSLAAAVARDGARVRRLGIVPDAEEELRRSVRDACREADLVLLSGGSSVGRADLVPRVLGELGPVVAHGLAIRPGKPTAVAACGAVPVLGLPGHPVSALVVYAVLGRPLLRLLAGEAGPGREPTVSARMDRNVSVHGGVEEYLRVALSEREDGLWAEPILGKSGVVSTLVRADGLVRVAAARRGLHRGDQVEVWLLRW